MHGVGGSGETPSLTMRRMSVQPDLPLRPMTLGELLDAATVLLRLRALPLLAAAAALAAAEQVLLAPLRAAQHLTPPFYGPADGHVGGWWMLTAFGFGLEGFIVTLLGALAGAAVGPALLDQPVRHRALWRRARPFAAVTAAVLVCGASGVAAFAGFVPWLLVYALFGLAGPALTVDRAGNPFSALARSARLTVRAGIRGARILLAGYLTWFAIRFALGAGWTAVAARVSGSQPQWQPWLVPVAWGLANTVAYAALACIAAVLLVDVRVRTEGLDIAIGLARGRGADPAAALVSTS
jgi:hypothetical protein